MLQWLCLKKSHCQYPYPSFACIKNKNTALKRLAVVTLLTFSVSNLLHVHFHRKFWLISVR